MRSTRRDFLSGTVSAMTATELSARFLEATTAGAAEGKTGLKVGGCTVELEQGVRCGLDGVEVRVGGNRRTGWRSAAPRFAASTRSEWPGREYRSVRS